MVCSMSSLFSLFSSLSPPPPPPASLSLSLLLSNFLYERWVVELPVHVVSIDRLTNNVNTFVWSSSFVCIFQVISLLGQTLVCSPLSTNVLYFSCVCPSFLHSSSVSLSLFSVFHSIFILSPVVFLFLSFCFHFARRCCIGSFEMRFLFLSAGAFWWRPSHPCLWLR